MLPLIDAKSFFVIHAPRQTGKTTLLRTVSRNLNREGVYTAITVSLECFTRADVDAMMPQILQNIAHAAADQIDSSFLPPEKEPFLSHPYIALKAYFPK